MEKPLRVLLTFPASAPHHRVVSSILELAKASLHVRPRVDMPDFDEEDPEQLAFYNRLAQAGVPIDVQVIDDEATVNAEREQLEHARAEWGVAQAAGSATALQKAEQSGAVTPEPPPPATEADATATEQSE